MPELPEVEIVRQSLNKKIKQKKVKKVIVRNRNLRFKIPLNFESFLEGQKIKKVERFSKYLIFCFSSNNFCLLHLGMSGTIHLVQNKKKSSLSEKSLYEIFGENKELPIPTANAFESNCLIFCSTLGSICKPRILISKYREFTDRIVADNCPDSVSITE